MRWLAKFIMKPGQLYKRGGVGLADLVCGEQQQADLFSAPNPRRERRVEVLDRINAKFGRGAVGLGDAGWMVGDVRLGEQCPQGKDV